MQRSEFVAVMQTSPSVLPNTLTCRLVGPTSLQYRFFFNVVKSFDATIALTQTMAFLSCLTSGGEHCPLTIKKILTNLLAF